MASKQPIDEELCSWCAWSDKRLSERGEPITDGGQTKMRARVLAERKAAGKSTKSKPKAAQKAASAKGKGKAEQVGKRKAEQEAGSDEDDAKPPKAKRQRVKKEEQSDEDS
jgi:hypothetical protein